MSQQPEKNREDSFRDARKQIVRSAFLALAALGVIVFACYAWFVSNNSVTGKISSVLLSGSTFELASVGSDSVFTENTPEAYQVENGESWPEGNNPTGKYTAGKSAIVWQLDSGSHLNNIADIEEDKRGIRPGSYGTLQFYIISKTEEDLNLNFDLELIPILKDGITDAEKDTLNQLIHGHMLFSYECVLDSDYNVENTPTLIEYNDSSFSLNFQNVRENQEILVTMKWIWPHVLEDVKNDRLQGVCSGSSVINRMKTAPEYFFYNEGNPVGKPNVEGTDWNNKFQEYNDYFNAADQFIGERLQWLIVRITAQTA